MVYGHGGEIVREKIDGKDLNWVLQEEQKGTGHAVLQAYDLIDDDSIVIVAYGDVPLIKSETLRLLADSLGKASMSILTTKLDDPFAYGRIIRNKQSKIEYIVEEKDANNEEKKVQEINTGFIAAKGSDLKRWLIKIKSDNSQGEYYLTDCISLAVVEGGVVEAVVCEDPSEVQGINGRIQQAQQERAFQADQAKQLMISGVTLADPKRIDVRGKISAGKDVFIDVNTVMIGSVNLGDGVIVESGCVIQDTEIGKNSVIKANSVIESAVIGESCDIGPFARIRPDTVVKDQAKVGNFVEVKKSTIGFASKVSHLSYIGDTVMGDDVNIGAGTITCNYDGANKFQTIIGDKVFVGSDTQLVAPVNIASGSTIGAGSTITKDTPADTLTLSRAIQNTITGWQRPTKNNTDK